MQESEKKNIWCLHDGTSKQFVEHRMSALMEKHLYCGTLAHHQRSKYFLRKIFPPTLWVYVTFKFSIDDRFINSENNEIIF